jgi:VanZ family protein
MNDSQRPFLKSYQHPKQSVIAMITDIKLLRSGAKICCVPIVVLLVVAALGPGKWTPRTALGWRFDHFIGYFGITLFFCFAWARPFVVGGVIMVLAAVLEALQVFTPDRSAYLPAAFYGAGGAIAACSVEKAIVCSLCTQIVSGLVPIGADAMPQLSDSSHSRYSGLLICGFDAGKS